MLIVAYIIMNNCSITASKTWNKAFGIHEFNSNMFPLDLKIEIQNKEECYTVNLKKILQEW